MSTAPDQNHEDLRNLLIRQMTLLKLNKEKVPLQILKTKYKNGYENLIQEIKDSSTAYANALTLSGIRFHKDIAEEGADRINRVIEQSGIPKQLSKAIFVNHSIDDFESLCNQLRKLILNEAEQCYKEHPGFLLTDKCLDTLHIIPMVFHFANGYAFIEHK